MAKKLNLEAELVAEKRELNEIRRQKFLETRDLENKESQIDHGKRMGFSDGNYYSQVKKGTSVIGEDVARKVEKYLSKPRYWMDGVELATLGERHQILIQRFDRFPTQFQDVILEFMKLERQFNDPIDAGRLADFQRELSALSRGPDLNLVEEYIETTGEHAKLDE